MCSSRIKADRIELEPAEGVTCDLTESDFSRLGRT